MENTEKLEQELGGLAVSLAKLEWAVAAEYAELHEEIKFWKFFTVVSGLVNLAWLAFFCWLAWGSK